MPKARITRTSVERLPKSDSQVIYWDTKLIGFGVRCNPDSRSWVVSYRIDSQEHRKTLGRCDRVDIDVAYTQAEAIIRDAAQNISPAGRIKLNAPAPVSAPVTLQMIYAEYLVARRHMKASTAAKYQEHIDRYLSDWLPLRMADITPDMIVAKHAEICTHAPVVADNVIGLVRALMNFAIDMHDGSIIARNPVAKLNKLDGWTNPRPRTSHLADSEIGPWVNACLKLAKDTTRDALLLLLHTGARRDEVLTLRWDNVDLPGETITPDKHQERIAADYPCLSLPRGAAPGAQRELPHFRVRVPVPWRDWSDDRFEVPAGLHRSHERQEGQHARSAAHVSHDLRGIGYWSYDPEEVG